MKPHPMTVLILSVLVSLPAQAGRFPIGDTIGVADRDMPLAITESGTPDAYWVYDGRGATVDVRHQHDQCVTIDASYVVVRGLTLQGAGTGETIQ